MSNDFVIMNKGDEPLIIKDAKTPCGCTVPSYPKEPIAPGDSAIIKVSFNSTKKMGYQNKKITLITNTKNVNEYLNIITEIK